jgi:hypothetical protein
VPGTPDPHWQVVDSQGTVYLLDRLQAKDGSTTRESLSRRTSRTSPRCRSGAPLPKSSSAKPHLKLR